MTEYAKNGDLWIPDNLFEKEIHDGILEICVQYLDEDDVAYIAGVDDQEEVIDYLYGRLLDIGQDPNELLLRHGVIEEGQR